MKRAAVGGPPQITKIELAIDPKTAKAFGMTVQPSLC
jgi:hypothetical protein